VGSSDSGSGGLEQQEGVGDFEDEKARAWRNLKSPLGAGRG